MTRIRTCLVLTAALALAPALSLAQFDQYTAPGSFEEERESTEELLERSAQEARWILGPIALDPWISVRDVAWVDSVEAGESGRSERDLTASAGLGVRGYVAVGREVTLAFHALPEYVWWKDRSERRRVNGRYGAGLFGNLGRTGVEVTLTRQDDADFVSREIERRVNIQDRSAAVSLESDLGRGVAVFAGGTLRQVRFLSEADDSEAVGLDNLERDEKLLRAGLRLHLPRGFAVSLGAERSEVDFERSSDRSNSGTSPILQLDYDVDPFFLALHLARRDLEPEPGSRFVPYEEVTGSLRLAWRTLGRLRLELFGNRNLVYSRTERWAYFEDSGLGAAVRMGLSSRMSLRVFVESGTNEYTAFVPEATERNDDFEAFGGDFHVRLGRFTLNLGASETTYDSNLPEFNRTTTVLRSGLNLGLSDGSPWG